MEKLLGKSLGKGYDTWYVFLIFAQVGHICQNFGTHMWWCMAILCWLLNPVNRLLSKGMLNIYLKVSIETSQGQFLGSPNSHRYHWIYYWIIIYLLFNLFIIYYCIYIIELFWFWKELWRFKVKESMHFVES